VNAIPIRKALGAFTNTSGGCFALTDDETLTVSGKVNAGDLSLSMTAMGGFLRIPNTLTANYSVRVGWGTRIRT
jgi:hypothetical protein